MEDEGRLRFADAVDAPGDLDVGDEELLSRAAGGRHEALAVLYDRYQALAYALALRITGHASLAQEVLQDAFLGAWRSAPRYSPERGSVRTWLLAIVRYRAVDVLRARLARPEVAEADTPTSEVIVPDVWPEVSRRLDREVVVRALAELPPVQREAIELAYFGGLTQTEISARTGAPLGTVKTRVRNGLIALRRSLDPAAADTVRGDRAEPFPIAGEPTLARVDAGGASGANRRSGLEPDR